MANLSKEGNIQHKLGFAGLLITLGIVFGDIGTSPLYDCLVSYGRLLFRLR